MLNRPSWPGGHSLRLVETEKQSCVVRGGLGQRVGMLVAAGGQGSKDPRKQTWFVAVAPDLGVQVAGLEIWRVGFDHQAVTGNILHECFHVGAATLVTNPTGDADVAVQVKAFVQFRLAAGKAVHDDVTEPVTVLP